MMTALSLSQRWDLAGIDGLQVAQSLFDDRISHLAPFQSLETRFETYPCAILRLCEGNFRIAVQGDCPALAQRLQQAQTQHRVWIKQFDWLSALVIPESIGLTLLPEIATTKPPFRLQGMESDRAVPARIAEISVLIWRHPVSGQPAFELHTATKDVKTVQMHLKL